MLLKNRLVGIDKGLFGGYIFIGAVLIFFSWLIGTLISLDDFYHATDRDAARDAVTIAWLLLGPVFLCSAILIWILSPLRFEGSGILRVVVRMAPILWGPTIHVWAKLTYSF